MTRPYTRTKQVQTTMRPADVDRLDALADQLGMSRANLIHDAILDRLERNVPSDNEEVKQEQLAYWKELQRLRRLRSIQGQ